MLMALLGSGEYLPVMNEVDRHLLAQSRTTGRTPRVVCLPTAAGQEGEASYGRWMKMGETHFRALNADVTALPLIDRAGADDPQFASVIANADLIYFSGGDPFYLHTTMNGSAAWSAVEKARARGAVFAGCSAGAMIMGAYLPNFRSLGGKRTTAFGALPRCTIVPHFDRMLVWRNITIPILQTFIAADEYVLGIDEDTALIGAPGNDWQVMGRQNVYVITHTDKKIFQAGEHVELPAE
jgi:cyanophycinase-like exopeptidase